jgi:hypothetical protein
LAQEAWCAVYRGVHSFDGEEHHRQRNDQTDETEQG